MRITEIFLHHVQNNVLASPAYKLNLEIKQVTKMSLQLIYSMIYLFSIYVDIKGKHSEFLTQWMKLRRSGTFWKTDLRENGFSSFEKLRNISLSLLLSEMSSGWLSGLQMHPDGSYVSVPGIALTLHLVLLRPIPQWTSNQYYVTSRSIMCMLMDIPPQLKSTEGKTNHSTYIIVSMSKL